MEVEEKDAELTSLYTASEAYEKQKEETDTLNEIIKDLRAKLDMVNVSWVLLNILIIIVNIYNAMPVQL